MYFLRVFVCLVYFACVSEASWWTTYSPYTKDWSNTNQGGNCTFESGMCGYYDLSRSFTWTRHQGSTPSLNTGPARDHTTETETGYYIYIETSSGTSYSTARLASSIQDPTDNEGLCLVFFYYMYGVTVHTLNVFISSDGGQSLIFSRSGDLSDRWWRATAHFQSSSDWQVIFEGTRGVSYTGDIAVDDISFLPGDCPTPDWPTTQPVQTDEPTTYYYYSYYWWPTDFPTVTPWGDIQGIRLAGGDWRSGRVEVLYNGEWGTVCDDGWDLADARVVCRQLGFGNAIQSYKYGYFGEGRGRIWMDEVNCSGYESSISNCNHNGFGVHDCSHPEDAGVLCGDILTTSETTSLTTPGCHCEYWCSWYGQCCDYCKVTTDGGSPPVVTTDGGGPPVETTTIDTTPRAYTTTPPSDPIRLVDGTTIYEGRVEILHNGIWGTVCDDSWDMNEARVVCRQLGYRDAEDALRYAYFGSGTGPIWFDDLQCSGSETSLDQCPHPGYGVHNCGHSEDASVRCTDPGEHIILRCGPSSFQVDIPNQLLDGTYYANDFYLSGDPHGYSCRGFYNGNLYISLNSSLTGCGTSFTENGDEILYENVVEINPSDGNSIVDFLGVEIPITCEYNSSERVQTHFKTLNDVIRKTAKGSFEFDFAMYTDISYAVRYDSYPVETRLNEELYFRAELIRSASNLEIHLRNCRATPSPDYDDAVVYEFIRDGCGINNAPVRVLTPNRPTQADFEITSFRFRKDLGNPESQIWVHCEVVVCDVNDANSECRLGCEQSRHRRSAETPPLKVKRMVQGPILFKGEVSGESESLMKTENSNGSPGIFMTILSAVSLVMFIGLVVMGVALGKVIRNSTRRGYQPVPNPSGTTTA